MEHKQNPTTGKLRKAINYQQMKIQQQISWVGQSTRYFLKGGEKFQPLGSKTLLTRQKGETVCTKEGESSCAATYALSCEFRSNTFEPFEQQIFCGATFYEGHLLLQMFNRLFLYLFPGQLLAPSSGLGAHIMVNILWTYYGECQNLFSAKTKYWVYHTLTADPYCRPKTTMSVNRRESK